MPRGRFERWSWQIHVAALISQRPHLQYLTTNVLLIAPVKRVENHGSPYLVSENSAPVHSLWLLKCPCYVSLWQNQGPKCQLGNDGWEPGPDGNYVILTKRGKKRPDFTPFCQIYHFRVKYAFYLHHLFHFDEICLQVIMLFTSFCHICLSVFAPSLEYLDIILCLWHEFFCLHRISENRRKLGLPKEKLIRVLPTGRTYKIK